jgi:plastocyanin
MLMITLLVAACGGAATSTPTTPGQPTAGLPTSAPSDAATEAPTVLPTTAVAATCVDVTDAGEATTVEAGAGGFSWSPDEITAAVGDVITWTNGDSVGHRVATDDGSCRMTSNIRGGASRSLRFTAAGEYPFFCTLHPDMKGTLIITE